MSHRVAPSALVSLGAEASTADESVNDLSRRKSLAPKGASAAEGQVLRGNVSQATRQRPMRNKNAEQSQADHPSICKPYLSIAELAQLTPWTDQAIRTMLSKGKLQEGVHFFYVGRRPVFKWEAIVAFIERTEKTGVVPHYRDQRVNGAKT
jgi:hypothetical protein